MTAVAVVLFLLRAPQAAGPGSGEMRISGRNSVADTLHDRALTFGIDFDRENPKASHVTPEASKALFEAGFGPWLNAEVERGDDSISEPPASVREFLKDHGDAIWEVIAALEKHSPEWGERPDEPLWVTIPLIPAISLEKVLCATALVEEHDGRSFESARALEASWSLGWSLDRAVADRRNTLSQLISIVIEKWQAGVLRKLHEPSLNWMGRLARDDPWTRMLDALTDEKAPPDPSGLPDSFSVAVRKSRLAIAEGLRKVSPCELQGLTGEDVWRLAEAALPSEISAPTPPPNLPEGAQTVREALKSIFVETYVSALRRASRLSVDRELSLRILLLKLEKQTSPKHLWPSELTDPGSTVCPDASYVYRADSGGMELRFDGSIDIPDKGTVLPLSFHSGKSTVTQTPTPSPAPTHTPEAP